MIRIMLGVCWRSRLQKDVIALRHRRQIRARRERLLFRVPTWDNLVDVIQEEVYHIRREVRGL